MASFALWTTAALAAVSVAAAVTQPSPAFTGAAVSPDPTSSTTTPTTSLPPTTAPTTLPTAPPPPVTAAKPAGTRPAPTNLAPSRPATAPPVAVATAPPTTAAYARATSARESCGWSWDATHFDDGSRNEVTLYLDAPGRPNSAVTITATPGASPAQRFATATDAGGQASVVVPLSNDKRDWSLTIGAQFPTSHCDERAFTIAY